jgi:hypothetical protein
MKRTQFRSQYYAGVSTELQSWLICITSLNDWLLIGCRCSSMDANFKKFFPTSLRDIPRLVAEMCDVSFLIYCCICFVVCHANSLVYLHYSSSSRECSCCCHVVIRYELLTRLWEIMRNVDGPPKSKMGRQTYTAESMTSCGPKWIAQLCPLTFLQCCRLLEQSSVDLVSWHLRKFVHCTMLTAKISYQKLNIKILFYAYFNESALSCYMSCIICSISTLAVIRLILLYITFFSNTSTCQT